jgi:endoglucanase
VAGADVGSTSVSRRISVVALTMAVAMGATITGAPPSRAGVATLVRVNQVGYATSAQKRAYVLSPAVCAGLGFDVRQGSTTVFTGITGTDLGSWNPTFPHVCPADFDALSAPGTYRVVLAGGPASPSFTLDTARALYAPLVDNAVTFFRDQRDGSDAVGGPLGLRPSHLHDRHAAVYAVPDYRGERLQGDLKKVGGQIDAEGGWFDAGDYVKFVGTTAFAAGAMLTVLRDHQSLFAGPGHPKLGAEAHRGIAWLLKMWNDRRRVLHYQVGIGSGNAQILGDHDVWRLPQKDDGMTQHARRYLAHRPVFRIGPPGTALPPSLAGRLAAVFGLCAQRAVDRPLGVRCLLAGEHVFALAKTHRIGRQITSAPIGYYREEAWRDDLEWGAVELFRALHDAAATPPDLPHRFPRFYLKAAARWAKAYVNGPHDGGDTLNLYDASALAHADLIQGMDAVGAGGLAISRGGLVTDLRQQLAPRARHATRDPFGFGAYRWDAVPHAFGLVSEVAAYDDATGTHRYAALARSQLNWSLGANAWGSSFVVGAGSTFPFCMQHQIANLRGSTDGTPPLLLGATVDGPNSYIPGPGFFGNAVACPPSGANPFAPFDVHGWRYIDRVQSWSTVEPSLDYTAMSMLAFAITADG